MMKNKNAFQCLMVGAYLAFYPLMSQSKIILPDLVSDNMVLQQQTDARLWGKATPGNTIYVSSDFSKEPVKVTVSADSTWLLTVQTPNASFAPHHLTFMERNAKGQILDKQNINNVLVGEVWYAGGQSNMEMPLAGFNNCPVEDAEEEIATAGDWKKKIRMATVPKAGSATPQEWVTGCKWQVPSLSTAPQMSAVAWFFAKMMEQVLQVPIGILTVAWGGSTVEGWTPQELLETYPEIDLQKELAKGWMKTWWHYHTPMVMYNGLLHPVRHYTIRGFIWYQGEANCGKKTYVDHMKKMIAVFRKEFGGTAQSLPFYLTEVAPYADYGDNDNGPLLRDWQHQIGREVENSGCICINDLAYPFEQHQVHPRQKRQVGYRFAYMVLNKTYGLDINTDYPEYDHMEMKGNKLHLFFRNAKQGFSRLNDIKGFEIAGADSVFHPAEAYVEPYGQGVFVSSKDVSEPRFVQYGYHAFCPGNLQSNRLLPVVPFRVECK